jgi:hypothetical protein
MKNKYGIYQATPSSCVLYKENKDGQQSTFTVLNIKKESKQDVLVFIDNEQANQENILLDDITSSEEILEAFNQWAHDAPVVFEMEAQSCLSHCIHPNDE